MMATASTESDPLIMMMTSPTINNTPTAAILQEQQKNSTVELESQSVALEVSPLEQPTNNNNSIMLAQQHHPDVLEQLRFWQRTSLWVSHILAFLAMTVVIWWISLLGGLSWKIGKAKIVFNWHPLGMIAAFCFMTVASLSFRFRFPSWNRQQVKLLHGISWAVALLCALVALIAVFQSHNDPVSGYIANLYSLHSWVGCAVILLYLSQFLIGVYTFGWPLSWMTPIFKAQVLTFHTFIGTFLYNATAATILMGIQEKEGFMSCSYQVTSPDLFPPQHFHQIPFACRVGHLLGIIVLIMTISTNFALHNSGSGGQSNRQTAKHH